MAVTLVSTGVRFPDNSIQTTAAGGGTYVYISTTTATNATNVDITIDSTYNTYIVECANWSVNTNIILGARFFNSGAPYTGTYRSQNMVSNSTSTKTAGYMEMTSLNCSNLSGFSAPLRTQIQRNPSNSRSNIFSTVSYYTGADYAVEVNAGLVQASITVTGIRFFDAYGGAANCLSGTFILYGVKTS